MLGGWSTIIDPIQLADKGARLTGELPLKGLRRLVEMCLDEQGVVSVDLQFEHDLNEGLRVMRGRIEAHVGLSCQRCMERFDCALQSEPRVLLLRPGEREDLAEAEDALVVDQPITIGTLVEDELLLEVPMVAMHPIEQCPARDALAAPEPERKPEQRANPFSVLKKLKSRDP